MRKTIGTLLSVVIAFQILPGVVFADLPSGGGISFNYTVENTAEKIVSLDVRALYNADATNWNFRIKFDNTVVNLCNPMGDDVTGLETRAFQGAISTFANGAMATLRSNDADYGWLKPIAGADFGGSNSGGYFILLAPLNTTLGASQKDAYGITAANKLPKPASLPKPAAYLPIGKVFFKVKAGKALSDITDSTFTIFPDAGVPSIAATGSSIRDGNLTYLSTDSEFVGISATPTTPAPTSTPTNTPTNTPTSTPTLTTAPPTTPILTVTVTETIKPEALTATPAVNTPVPTITEVPTTVTPTPEVPINETPTLTPTPEPSEQPVPFSDVSPTAWFYDNVSYVWKNGIMTGVKGDLFEPDTPSSRGMVVTVLWRMMGSPKGSGFANFADVSTNAWFAEAVGWAYKNGVVTGLSANEFAPDAPIARQEFAAIMARYARQFGMIPPKVRDYPKFADQSLISDYAKDDVVLLYEAEILNGKPTGFDPTGQAIRAEMAAILNRFSVSVK